MIVYTIGHSTRSIDAFLQLLEGASVRKVWDIRRFPGSRRVPQFGTAPLERALGAARLDYEHHPELGGRRRPSSQGPASAWRNASFRGYAEYMTTPDFRRGLDALIETAKVQPTAIMCAEALPWRCHRNLVADALVARGVTVRHILDRQIATHTLTPFAVLRDGQVFYPPVESDQTNRNRPASR